MSLLIFVFGSGLAFFGGVALLLIGVGLAFWRPRFCAVFVLLGLIVIALAAAPLPYWFYASAGLATVGWLLAERFQKRLSHATLNWARAAIAVLWLGGAAGELRYQGVPVLESSGRPALWIVADSVTAGVDDGKTATWPGILARDHHIEVHDLSQMGATLASANRRLQKDSLGSGLVILEIGGNDLLGSTTVADFEVQFDALLARLCQPGRTVLMFELPLPPLCNDYGRIQRNLAVRYGVRLIPKRILVGILTAPDATMDSIHLTQHGHEILAAEVWSLIEAAYD
jgi:acyl-CoA thioesterase-1